MYDETSKPRRWIWIALILPMAFACESNCPGPPTEPEPGAAAKIRVEDTHVSTWMVFDNGWTGPLGPQEPEESEESDDPNQTTDGSLCDATGPDAAEKKFGLCASYVKHTVFIPGVLYQLGMLYQPLEADPETLVAIDNLAAVWLTIEKPGEEPRKVQLREEGDLPGEPDDKFFDWLDVLPMKDSATNLECVIDAKHAYMLFETDHAKTICDPTADWTNQCLRNRALHASFRPNKGVITYWADPEKRYSVETLLLNVSGHTHITYDFELDTVVSVDVWRDGCWQERLDHVTQVLIQYASPPFHGGYHDPPMDGGDIGK